LNKSADSSSTVKRRLKPINDTKTNRRKNNYNKKEEEEVQMQFLFFYLKVIVE
jgi:hypothetical protein